MRQAKSALSREKRAEDLPAISPQDFSAGRVALANKSMLAGVGIPLGLLLGGYGIYQGMKGDSRLPVSLAPDKKKKPLPEPLPVKLASVLDYLPGGEAASSWLSGQPNVPTNPYNSAAFTVPATAAVLGATYGGLQLKQYLDRKRQPGGVNKKLLSARNEFQSALDNELTGKSAEFKLCMHVLNKLEEQAGKKADFSSWYLPAALLGAAGTGVTAYNITRKLDPNRIKARAARDALARQRRVQPPAIQLTSVDPGENPKDIAALSDSNQLLVPMNLSPGMQKAAEAVSHFSDLQKVALVAASLANHGFLTPEQVKIAAYLEKMADGAGVINNLTSGNFGGAAQDAWGNIKDVAQGAGNFLASPLVAAGNYVKGKVIDPALDYAGVRMRNAALGGGGEGGGVMGGLGEAGGKLFGMLKNMHPAEMIALLGGVLGVGSSIFGGGGMGAGLGGLALILLGLFGKGALNSLVGSGALKNTPFEGAANAVKTELDNKAVDLPKRLSAAFGGSAPQSQAPAPLQAAGTPAEQMTLTTTPQTPPPGSGSQFNLNQTAAPQQPNAAQAPPPAPQQPNAAQAPPPASQQPNQGAPTVPTAAPQQPAPTPQSGLDNKPGPAVTGELRPPAQPTLTSAPQGGATQLIPQAKPGMGPSQAAAAKPYGNPAPPPPVKPPLGGPAPQMGGMVGRVVNPKLTAGHAALNAAAGIKPQPAYGAGKDMTFAAKTNVLPQKTNVLPQKTVVA